MMLYKLLSRTDRSVFEPEVVSLLDRGAMGERIEALGVRVQSLGMTRGPGAALGLGRLVRSLRHDPVDIVQCWMYHADLVGGVAARLAGIRRIIWGIRQGAPVPHGTKLSTRWVARACAKLSRSVPTRIVCCSEAARRDHVALGYDAAKMTVIANGFDLESFQPDPACRGEIRKELGIPEQTFLVGLVARFHPQKDHESFLAAAAAVAARLPETHFLLCGEGIDGGNQALLEGIARLGLRGRMHLIGQRRDVARITAALDVACSSSAFAEGLPNAIGEAMACAVPCVVTDVGDSAELVGDTGRVVLSGDPARLAEAITSLLAADSAERRKMGEAARNRIREHYALPVIVERYERLYREVLSS